MQSAVINDAYEDHVPYDSRYHDVDDKRLKVESTEVIVADNVEVEILPLV
jgi:hypothetical protein